MDTIRWTVPTDRPPGLTGSNHPRSCPLMWHECVTGPWAAVAREWLGEDGPGPPGGG
jgi:hypothetical protein